MTRSVGGGLRLRRGGGGAKCSMRKYGDWSQRHNGGPCPRQRAEGMPPELTPPYFTYTPPRPNPLPPLSRESKACHLLETSTVKRIVPPSTHPPNHAQGAGFEAEGVVAPSTAGPDAKGTAQQSPPRNPTPEPRRTLREWHNTLPPPLDNPPGGWDCPTPRTHFNLYPTPRITNPSYKN